MEQDIFKLKVWNWPVKWNILKEPSFFLSDQELGMSTLLQGATMAINPAAAIFKALFNTTMI